MISILLEIIHVLFKHSSTNIGTSSCDVRSYKTDANGNLYIGSDSFNKFILIVSPKSQSSSAAYSNKPIHDIISIIAQDDNNVKLKYHLQKFLKP